MGERENRGGQGPRAAEGPGRREQDSALVAVWNCIPRDGNGEMQRIDCTGDERRRTVEGRSFPGPERLRNASRELSPMLAAGQCQLEQGPGSSRQAIRAARQEIHLAAPTADPSLDPSQPDANPFPFELLSNLARPKAAAALGTRLLCQFGHRVCPRLDGVTHHGAWGM